jgi:hypothetical protein
MSGSVELHRCGSDAGASAAEEGRKPAKPALTCGFGDVIGATQTGFDLVRRGYVMFCLSPGSGGTQGREAGRPAPGGNPN